jgi:signal transduction histidine kinase
MSAIAVPLARPEAPKLAVRSDRMNSPEDEVQGHAEANAVLRAQKAAAEALLAQSAADLATPMSLILGYRQLMDAHPKLHAVFERDAEARALLDGMGGAITQMQAVLQNLSLTARALSGSLDLTLGRVKLTEVLARVLSGYAEPMRQRQINLRFERVHIPNAMDADEGLLEVVFGHLISNAIKFTPDSGTITLGAQVIPGATPGGVLRLSIRDSGVGIATDDLEQIFSAYTRMPGKDATQTSRTDFLGPGTGLGLAVCKAIVEAHGGRLWAESAGYDLAQCPGSTFIVVLPVREQRES